MEEGKRQDAALLHVPRRRVTQLVLSPEAIREWMRLDIVGKKAEKIVSHGAVGNVKNQGGIDRTNRYIIRCPFSMHFIFNSA